MFRMTSIMICLFLLVSLVPVLQAQEDIGFQDAEAYDTMGAEFADGIIEELITGDTVEAINQSLENARALISRVRQVLEEEVAKTRVPSGAPQRAPPDLSALSPREKIQYAIGGKR